MREIKKGESGVQGTLYLADELPRSAKLPPSLREARKEQGQLIHDLRGTTSKSASLSIPAVKNRATGKKSSARKSRAAKTR
jgi:hypothetical protein